MEPILKPCPFCGRSAVIDRLGNKHYGDMFGVSCIGCFGEISVRFETEQRAAEAWNKRTPLAHS